MDDIAEATIESSPESVTLDKLRLLGHARRRTGMRPSSVVG